MTKSLYDPEVEKKGIQKGIEQGHEEIVHLKEKFKAKEVTIFLENNLKDIQTLNFYPSNF